MNFYNKIGVEYPDWQNCIISLWGMHNILDVAFYRESWSNRFNKHNSSIDGDNNDDDDEDDTVTMSAMIATGHSKIGIW